MKFQIVYNPITKVYIPKHKSWGKWKNFTKSTWVDQDGVQWYQRVIFSTPEEAVEFCNEMAKTSALANFES